MNWWGILYVLVFSKIEQNTHFLLPTEMKSTLETLSFGKLMNSDSPDLISILACLLLLLLLYSLFLNFPIHYFWLNYLPLDWFRATITSTDVLNLYTAQNHIKNVGGNKKFNIRIFHIFHNHYSSYLSLFITLITKWVWISRIRHILGTFWCSVNYTGKKFYR